MSDSKKPTPSAENLDREFRAHVARMSGGLSPTAYTTAWVDWATHFMLSPAKQLEVQQEAWKRAMDTWTFTARALTGAPAAPNEGFNGDADKRFAGDAWSQFPFNVIARVYQNSAALTRQAIENVDGVTDYHTDLVEFSARQGIDASAPSNYLATNPELLAITRAESGQNLVRGVQNLVEDVQRLTKGLGPVGVENFELGKTVATTPGKVVYRNALIEVIQYAATTPDVHAEPILIVPAWIMKYYILDLSPKNSMIKYLADQGHTVFTISWKNPTAADRELGMDDYVNLGLRAALDAVTTIVPDRQVHGVGYCIGGTLLSIGAATLAREGDQRLRSITMFAAQTDFSEPGELALFINPSQLAMLEATMHKEGVLDSQKMGGAFQMLRPQELIWQPIINSYLKGNRDVMIDLMAWNADGTRMPWKMHSEYLYRLYLDNELATNRFPVGGQPIRLSDIRVPMFVVGTESDHVAPWKSVYKTGNLVRSDDFTFLLTSSGHNAGIVVGPVHPKRHFRMQTRRLIDAHLAPDEWLAATPVTSGSWWPAWEKWLAEHSSGRAPLPAIGNADKNYAILEDAPGQYVKQR
jgi:polyhydroxyalkanoate synthase